MIMHSSQENPLLSPPVALPTAALVDADDGVLCRVHRVGSRLQLHLRRLQPRAPAHHRSAGEAGGRGGEEGGSVNCIH